MSILAPDHLGTLSKAIESAHRYLQIAFSEELYLYCQENGMNFQELRNALNTKWNVQILEPGEGRKRSEVPRKRYKGVSAISKSIKSKILTSAMEVDEDYMRYRTSTLKHFNL